MFVCVHNAGRSHMAAGFLAHIAGDRIDIRSAGSEPAEQINPGAVEAMAEVGIDITEHGRWCQNGTMKRMNLRDVPDDVYVALSDAAAANRQSLSAFVVDRLTEAAQVARLGDYLAAFEPIGEGHISLEDAVAVVREVREVS